MKATNEEPKETKVKKSRMKSLWTKNDVIIALLYTKFGFRKIGVENDEVSLEYFVNEYIGSNLYSLEMESNNIKNLLNYKRNDSNDNPYDHTSKTQETVVYEYDGYTEDELANIVNNILDNITDEQRKENLSHIDKEVFENRMRAKKEKEEQKILNKRQKTIEKMLNENRCIVAIVNSDKKYYISGDSIEHKTYGDGIIIDVEGKKIKIDFNDKNFGLKTLFFNETYFNL